MDTRIAKLGNPFCTLPEAAWFLDISVNQAEKLWASGRLPRAYAVNGREFRPTGDKLVPAPELRAMLDEDGAAWFDDWQAGDFTVTSPGRKLRRVRARSGLAAVPLPKGPRPLASAPRGSESAGR